jgi:hypothetical protein
LPRPVTRTYRPAVNVLVNVYSHSGHLPTT